MSHSTVPTGVTGNLAAYSFEVTALGARQLQARLEAAGVDDPCTVSSLALAAIARRLSPAEALELACSTDAAAVIEELEVESDTEEHEARVRAVAEGKVVVLSTRRP